jgi:hypothetical protein
MCDPVASGLAPGISLSLARTPGTDHHHIGVLEVWADDGCGGQVQGVVNWWAGFHCRRGAGQEALTS